MSRKLRHLIDQLNIYRESYDEFLKQEGHSTNDKAQSFIYDLEYLLAVILKASENWESRNEIGEKLKEDATNVLSGSTLTCWGVEANGERLRIPYVRTNIKGVAATRGEICMIHADNKVLCKSSFSNAEFGIIDLPEVKLLTARCAMDFQNKIYCWTSATKSATLFDAVF